MPALKILKSPNIPLLSVFFCLLASGLGFSQHHSSQFSWQHETYNPETASVAMANQALTHFINPAVGGQKHQFRLRSNLGSSPPYSTGFENAGFDPVLVNFGISYTDHSYWAAFTYETLSYDWFNQGPYKFQVFRLHTGYQLTRLLAVGIGAGINRSSIADSPDDSNTGGHPAQTQHSLSFEMGAYYSQNLTLGRFGIQPEFGLSLNNIGSYHKFEPSSVTEVYAPQPGRLSGSAGLKVTDSNEWRERNWYSVQLYAGLNKYFSRMPDQNQERGSGLRDIFTNWGSFVPADGAGATISAGEQIALSMGFSLTLLETLSVHYGRLSGADLWVRARQTRGAGLDFRYLAINVTAIDYESEATWDRNSSLIFYEAIVNLPLSLFDF